MHTKRWTIAGTALATLALTASSIGVVAQDAQEELATGGVPAVPTGYAELDQALSGGALTGTRSSSRPSGSAGRARTSRRPSPPSWRPPASTSWSTSIGSSHETVLQVSRQGRQPA